MKKIAGASKNLKGFYNGLYLEIVLNRKTGEVWANEYYDLGHNTHTLYDDYDIVSLGNIYEQKTMKELKDWILEKLYLI